MPPDMLGAVDGAVDGGVGLVAGASGAFSGSGSEAGVRSGDSPDAGRDDGVGDGSRLGDAGSSRFGVGEVCGFWDGCLACWLGLGSLLWFARPSSFSSSMPSLL